MARAITFHFNIPLNLWNFSIKHVVHLINHITSPLLKSKCPYEKIFNTFPVIIHLKVFGSLCFSTTIQNHRTKFQPGARKVVFLEYKDGTKGYLLYDLQSNELFVSRNVIFYDSVFPFKKPLKPTFDPTLNRLDNNHPLLDLDMDPVTNHPTLLYRDPIIHSIAPETPNITPTPA